MSNLHAYTDDCAAPSTAFDFASIVRDALARIAAAVAKRWPRDLHRYPDHLLADMGFERDWDGTIIRATRH